MTSLIILVWKAVAVAAAAGLLGVAAFTFVSETGAESAGHGQQGQVGAAGIDRPVLEAPSVITARYPMPVLSMVVLDSQD